MTTVRCCGTCGWWIEARPGDGIGACGLDDVLDGGVRPMYEAAAGAECAAWAGELPAAEEGDAG